MGMKQLPKRSGEYLFEIVMRRYETRSTVMTSIRPLEDWGKLLGDVPSATAILDRFLHHAELVTITGRSYRLRNRGGKTEDLSKEEESESRPPEGASERTKSKPAKAPIGSGATIGPVRRRREDSRMPRKDAVATLAKTGAIVEGGERTLKH